jgi:hypothetical protein
MLKVRVHRLLTHPLCRLLAVVGLVALTILAIVFGLKTLHQPDRGEVWSGPLQDYPPQHVTQPAAPSNNTQGQSELSGRGSAGSQGTNQGSSQGPGQGGTRGSGK